jgi:hypothetical protein
MTNPLAVALRRLRWPMVAVWVLTVVLLAPARQRVAGDHR